ncbi:MAG: hypothetical protein Q8941_10020 [Bacteroidota bacterium]|nr:hypothetical protein [Bacteroidota bacterium]
MTYSIFLRPVLVIACISFVSSRALPQECMVAKEPLKGIYTGDCKNGKADGKGKAVGTDTYEGEFKAGLPDGQGTYTWSNGNSYTGKFVKGLKEGKGVLNYKRTNASDSMIDGYWKKDGYIGRYEHPYIVHYTSRNVTEVEVQLKKTDGYKQVTFYVTNTSGGAATMQGQMQKMTVDDIQLTRGSYGRTEANSDHAKKTETILHDVLFPARMKVTIGSEQVEIEFNEEGNYLVNVSINL